MNAVASKSAARVFPKGLYASFADRGFAGPVRVLSPRECKQFLQTTGGGRKEPPLDWDKGYAAGSRMFYETATHPAIVEVVAALLGEDILLWGASIQVRSPGAIHPWHSDIEASFAAAGKTVSVWIGLQGTSPASSLLLIPYSHRLGISVQEARHRADIGRHEATNEDIVRWARERDVRSHLKRLEMSNGEAVFFDGQLWHCSHNRSAKTRRALLLQYATPDTAIRIPDLNYVNWPFHHLSLPRPACVMVRGSSKPGINRIVPAPVPGSVRVSCQLTNRIYPLSIPLAPGDEKGWKPYPIFSGATADLRKLSCHASVLTHGQCPHAPHMHDEEELLLLLAGEVDLILPAERNSGKRNRRRLRSGEFVYYPANFPHTLETVSENAAHYLMFKWYTGRTGVETPLAFGHYNALDALTHLESRPGFKHRVIFTGPTAYLRQLQCHVSTLAPGAGYEPHVDAYDVAIIILEGEVETLDERVGPFGVIFYPAGECHGIRNPGKATAKYIVFEFHGSQTKLSKTDPFGHAPSLFAKLCDPRRVKRKLKAVLRRVIR